jgi:hypothetical protein
MARRKGEVSSGCVPLLCRTATFASYNAQRGGSTIADCRMKIEDLKTEISNQKSRRGST